MYSLVKFTTKEPVSNDQDYIFTGEDSPWEVVMDMEAIRSQINVGYFRDTPPSIAKYFPFLPIKKRSEFVSLKEGNTPLLRSQKLGKHLGISLYFKLESKNPTGAFKDRGSALEISLVKEWGVKGICVASTGNMAASCACYAASAHIPCFIFVPELTPASKLAQAISYGGRIVQVKGTYNDAASLAEKIARELHFYLAGDYAFRVEGAKTAAFEIIDQLYYHPPHAVIVPIGCGTNIASYLKGFREYRALGLLDTIPRLIGAQAEGASPVVESFRKASRTIEPWKQVSTIASAICIGGPLDGVKALDAIYSTKGEAVSVSETEILEAQFLLAKDEGIFIEPAAATSFAVAKKLAQQGKLIGERVVCVFTGEGLKDPAAILKVALKPPIIQPTVSEFLSLYENSFFEGKTIAIIDGDSPIFEKIPTINDIRKQLHLFTDAQFNEMQLTALQKEVEGFLKKGKVILASDFQDIIQDVLKSLAEMAKTAHRVFTVEDFTVCTSRDKQPTASVEVLLHGERLSAESVGVGPVDAVINALRKACGEKIDFSLVNYNVAIRSQGTDAVVVVDISLKRAGKVSVAQSTSPDVIQASINAFERAYNGLE